MTDAPKRFSVISFLSAMALAIMTMTLMVACNQPSHNSIEPGPSTDQQATLVPMRYAKRLQIETIGNLKRLTIKKPWRGAGKDFVYILYPKGSEKPTGFNADAVIPVPVERVIITSTTSAPYFVKLDITDAICAVTNPELINTPEVASLIKSGKIKSVGGTNGTTTDFDVELLIGLKPDLVIAHSSGSTSHDVFPKVQRVGIPVVFNASWMEETPLGRTEWIRFYAAFFGKDIKAEQEFDKTTVEYSRLASLIPENTRRPKVVSNIAYKGTWYVSGGRSYMAKYLQDAGADYPWADNPESGGVPTDFEVILARAKDADIWLNPGLCRSLQEVKAVDSRYLEFTALKEGNVYNHTKKRNASGGLDYWESGSANPHLVLADLISIFHPDLLPEHERVWYEKLPETLNGPE